MTDKELVAFVSVINQSSADQDMEDAEGSEAEAEVGSRDPQPSRGSGAADGLGTSCGG